MSDALYFRNQPQYTNYFSARNTTPGTGIAGHAAPTTADNTKPLIYLFNGSSSSRIYLDHIKARVTAVGAGATNIDFAVFIDNCGAASRASGGTQITPVNNSGVTGSPQNVAGPYADATLSTVYFGPVVATPVSTKQVAATRVRPVVPVVEDQYFMDFNYPASGFFATGAPSGTALYVANITMAPVVLAPLQALYVVQWGASQSGAHSFDLEVTWIER